MSIISTQTVDQLNEIIDRLDYSWYSFCEQVKTINRLTHTIDRFYREYVGASDRLNALSKKPLHFFSFSWFFPCFPYLVQLISFILNQLTCWFSLQIIKWHEQSIQWFRKTLVLMNRQISNISRTTHEIWSNYRQFSSHKMSSLIGFLISLFSNPFDFHILKILRILVGWILSHCIEIFMSMQFLLFKCF